MMDYFSPNQAHSFFYVVRATWVKFGLHVGDMKFNTQNEW
jgi:hypothetical protein